MRRPFAIILSVLLPLSGAACPADNSGYPTDGGNTSTGEGRPLTDGSTSAPPDGRIFSVPAELAEIPTDYYSPAEEKGTLVELYYDTYESMTYEQHTRPLQKRAIVYLPYGYTDETEYAVFYLMHGGWGNETTTLGTPDHPSRFKHVIDSAIQDGTCDRLIIVCPTYNNTNENGQDSANFSLALQLNLNYHNELINDLIPAVEGRYHTHAGDVTAEGIAASRDHRGFGGFSMGSVATWRTFQNCLDYFSYFLPMSCGTGLDDDRIFEAANGRKHSDYFVFNYDGYRRLCLQLCQ